ncbi:MAG: radical SAM protein [Candidatus Bathyarchaeia archaeon]
MEQHSIAAPNLIRVSVGTAIVLGLAKGKLDAVPTTAYFMTYRDGKCTANCGFCPQARESKGSSQMLSRITWPTYPTEAVLKALAEAVEKKRFGRVCIQALNYPEVFVHLEALVKEIKRDSAVAVSVSCQPKTRENILRLKEAGVERLGIALDAASEAVFIRVKGADAGGCYSWDNQFRLLGEALSVFGLGNVSTHVIVGLGESEREAAEVVQRVVDLGVLPALFAFTPVRGTALEGCLPPKVQSYRCLQLARYLIVSGKSRAEKFHFTEGRITDFGLPKEQIENVVDSGLPFRTSGCPSCNRPYYNEKPSGPIYNFPYAPTNEEIGEIKADLE